MPVGNVKKKLKLKIYHLRLFSKPLNHLVDTRETGHPVLLKPAFAEAPDQFQTNHCETTSLSQTTISLFTLEEV